MDRIQTRFKELRIDNDLTKIKVAKYLGVLEDTY